MEFSRYTLPSQLLSFELQQSADEGKDVVRFEQQAAAIAALPDSVQTAREQQATNLFLAIQAAKISDQYPYVEPSEWDKIFAACKIRDTSDQSAPTQLDKLLGGILGKCIGCLLGKPIEGWLQHKIISFLKESNNFPIQRYLFDSLPLPLYEKYHLSKQWTFPISGMPEDDDVSHLFLAFKTIQQFGVDFQPHQVAEIWTKYIPLEHVYTAERLAYRNFANGIFPPASAYFCNPYREWVGAQIRADVYGYLCPGKPRLAMELAWKDASISHIKNGIYGSIWVAVMLALIPTLTPGTPWEQVIRQAIQYIPSQSRLKRAILYTLQAFKENTPLDIMLSRIHSHHSEDNIHHWCHVVPNAMIVSTALLWGQNNFLTSLQITIAAGFDTDSNGATVGSLIGYAIGAEKIPCYWKNALQNTIFSSVVGMHTTNIKEFATELFTI